MLIKVNIKSKGRVLLYKRQSIKTPVELIISDKDMVAFKMAVRFSRLNENDIEYSDNKKIDIKTEEPDVYIIDYPLQEIVEEDVVNIVEEVKMEEKLPEE